MPLVDIPEELLCQIFSYRDVLGLTELRNLTVSCRRLHSPALMNLYSRIKIRGSKQPYEPDRLNKLISILDRYPNRAGWIQSADFLWNGHDSQTASQIFNLLAKFPALSELILHAFDSDFLTSRFNPPGYKEKSNPSGSLLRLPIAASLRSLVIEDFQIDISDIAKILALPNLEHVSIYRFDDKLLVRTGPPINEPSFPPHSGKIKKLEFWWSSPPVGPVADYILSGHPCLESLTWDLTKSYLGFLRTSISKLLFPVSATLVELRLLGFTCEPEFVADFSNFQSLKALEIQSGLLFRNRLPTFPKSYSALHKRLPKTLESLTIVFPPGTSWFLRKISRKILYQWLVYLAEQKADHIPRLSLIQITEGEWPARKEVVEGRETPLRDWEHPQDVLLAIHTAGMKLKVTVRNEWS